MADEEVQEQLRRRAAFLREMGLDYGLVQRRPIAAAGPGAPGSPRPGSAAASSPAGRSLPEARRDAADPAAELRRIQEDIGDCRRCRLCEQRHTVVFGVGNPHARVMFVGEGPGAEEDARGEPFVGRAGQLLTDIITKGMGLRRSETYIANIVKCRPPGNREPLPDEVDTCLPFLEAQIQAIHPEVIVGLGKTAVQALLGSPVQITKVRGQWTNFRGIPLLPTFHPSYLLRNPAAKKDVWADIQQVMSRLGLAVRGRV